MQNNQCSKSQKLGGELWQMFLSSRSSMLHCGAISQIRRGSINCEGLSNVEIILPQGMGEPDDDCHCNCDHELNQSCGSCETPVDEVCKEDTLRQCKDEGVFEGLGELLSNVKLHEFTSAVSETYAQIGDTPHQLKARKTSDLSDHQRDIASKTFFDYLQAFLDDNEVTIDELPEVFGLGSLQELRDTLIDLVRRSSEALLRESMEEYSDIITEIFRRTRFMHEYQRCIEDTKYYPIGIMWCDANSWVKKREIKNGKLAASWDIQTSAERIDPRYFWTTSDWTRHDEGQACFRMKKLSRGAISRMSVKPVCDCVKTNIDLYLEQNENGSRMMGAALFSDNNLMNRNDVYEVLICRGWFSREALSEAGVTIKGEWEGESHIRCEVYYGDGMVISVNVLPFPLDNFGVYTCTFREAGTDSLYGIPLYEFIRPFANFYQSIFNALDESVEKTLGAILSMDTGVLEDPEQYLTFDKNTGTWAIDLDGYTIFKFDSSNAIGSPNFKGVPIHIQQLPSNLPTLLPLISLCLEQLSIITGIPSMLNNGMPSSSALRKVNSTF